ncbi:hypothetical protein N0V82_003351 [Gnomoniopsis sp. IMI 355080]|nr:hypothetical protein N0V82_003351 [Gnomoniopsis sp. IMI 355080]
MLNMLPPVEETVLKSNPDFAALYNTLTTAILNSDGTTKDDQSRAARERDAVRKELEAHRLKSAREHLLAQAISLVSSNLQSSAVQLARAANPSTNASFLHRHIPSIPVHVNTLSNAASQQAASLADARLATANSLIELLEKHNQALSQLIRSLEAKHGGVARSLELRGAEMALEAQRGEVETESALWAVRRDVYSPEVREALSNYANHLKDGQRRLKEAARTASMELSEYGVNTEGQGGDAAKERRFREVARAHRDVRRQIDEAKRDLSRLR